MSQNSWLLIGRTKQPIRTLNKKRNTDLNLEIIKKKKYSNIAFILYDGNKTQEKQFESLSSKISNLSKTIIINA